jgi:hypothetical protein
MKPIGKCPACGEDDPPAQDAQGLYQAYKKLADQGHQGALERLDTLLAQMVTHDASNQQLQEDRAKYQKMRYGPEGEKLKQLGITQDTRTEMQQEMMRMLLSGMSQEEVHSQMLSKFKGKIGRGSRAPQARSTGATGSSNCDHCSKPGADKLCSRCNHETYCNRDCQKSAWKEHKKKCGKKKPATK